MPIVRYTIERSLLEKADIILTREKSLVSTGIRVATLGKYSHAAIYVGETTIEATQKGVFSKNPQRMIFDNESDVAVYRSRRVLGGRELDAICSHAQSKVGSLYALDETLTIGARSMLRLEEKKRQFCSRLVANAYAHIGYDFINLRFPAYCTPKQLSLCKAFEQVHDIVRKATDAEIEFAETPDLSLDNLDQTYEWLNNVRSLALSKFNKEFDIQTISDVSDFLLLHPEFDDDVSNYIRESGFLYFYKHYEEICPYLYDEALFLVTLSNSDNPNLMIKSALDREGELIRRYANMFDGCSQYCDKRNLKFYRIHAELYINLLKGVHRRIQVMQNSLQMCGDMELADEMSVFTEGAGQLVSAGERRLRILKPNAIN